MLQIKEKSMWFCWHGLTLLIIANIYCAGWLHLIHLLKEIPTTLSLCFTVFHANFIIPQT